MDDKRLDELLGEAVGSAPPEDVVRAVSPWRHAMNQVLWGFALTSISLNFLLLNYILPSIGAVLMLLGFRTLRANRHFRIAYYASMLRCALQIAVLFLAATVIRSEVVDLVLTVLSAVFALTVTLELYMGIMDAQEAAVLELRAPAAAIWLMVWYILLYALGLLTAAGSIVGLLMLARRATPWRPHRCGSPTVRWARCSRSPRRRPWPWGWRSSAATTWTGSRSPSAARRPRSLRRS